MLLNLEKLTFPNVIIVGNDMVPRDTNEVFQEQINLKMLGEKKHRVRYHSRSISLTRFVFLDRILLMEKILFF